MLAVSMMDNENAIIRMIKNGARGYVLKDAVSEDLLKAIHTIQQGTHYFSRKIAEIATQYLARTGKDSSAVWARPRYKQ